MAENKGQAASLEACTALVERETLPYQIECVSEIAVDHPGFGINRIVPEMLGIASVKLETVYVNLSANSFSSSVNF